MFSVIYGFFNCYMYTILQQFSRPRKVFTIFYSFSKLNGHKYPLTTTPNENLN